MKIGLLSFGVPKLHLPDSDTDYEAMFNRLFEGHDIELTNFAVPAGELPTDPADFDGYVLSGSPSSVYDQEGWIRNSEDFLRDTFEAAIPQVCVCFGHQLIAQALGGEVRKAKAGWGVGVNTYQLELPDAPWVTTTEPHTVSVQAMHQDQVIRMPEGAHLWLTSAYAPLAGFTIDRRVWTIQPHPEFSEKFSRALIDSRRILFGDTLWNQGLSTVGEPTDNELLADWMAAFLRG